MEILLHQLHYLSFILAYVAAEVFIIERSQVTDDPVDHAFGEYAVLQVN